jgi:hypothetical protein
MATTCVSLARGKMYRLTRLDDCGVPVAGATSVVTSKGFVSVTATPVYQDQEDITQTDANGDTCIDDQSDPALRWLTLEIVLCNLDPFAINIITGDPVVVDDDTPTPNTVGWRWDSAVSGSAEFGLEVWSGVPGQACDPAGFPLYGYWLYPFVVQATIGEYVVENGALTLTLTARTSAGSGWGVGAYDVRRDANTPFAPEPLLTAIGPTQHGHFEVASAPLPTPACGATVYPPA